MPPTDYVSRGQKRKKKPVKKASVPWLRVFLAFALLGAFGFGLFKLQTLPNGQDEQASASETVVEISEQQEQGDVALDPAIPNKEPLPTLGEEEWAFIDALPEYEVEIDPPEDLESDRKFIMQCGSFRTTDRAEELRARLALQGLEAQVLQSSGSSGVWYRVVLGPYERKRQAERDRHQLRRAGINGCKIW